MQNLLHLFLICYPPALQQNQISGEVMLITQNHFLNNFVFVTNWGRRYLGCPYEQNYMSSSLMIPIKKRLMGFVEQVSLDSELSTDVLLTVGAVYLFNENIHVDAFLSQTFKNTPSMLQQALVFPTALIDTMTMVSPMKKKTEKTTQKNRIDRKMNAKIIKEYSDRERERKKAERKQKKSIQKE